MAELYRRRFPATPEAVPLARHDVLDILDQAGLADPTLRANVALAVSEATTNAVRHAYPPDRIDGHVDIAVTRAHDSVTVTVSDEGLGMDSRISPQGSGLGLLIMSAEAQDVAVKSDQAGTTVALRFTMSTDSPSE
jgi:anti-sigma regulatory factor (Ser/Thr protein kinase)